MAKFVCIGENVNDERIGLRDVGMIDGKGWRLEGGLCSRGRRTLTSLTFLISSCVFDAELFSAGPVHENDSPVVC